MTYKAIHAGGGRIKPVKGPSRRSFIKKNTAGTRLGHNLKSWMNFQWLFRGLRSIKSADIWGEEGKGGDFIKSWDPLTPRKSQREDSTLSFPDWAFNHLQWLSFTKCVVFLLGTIADYKDNRKEKVKVQEYCVSLAQIANKFLQVLYCQRS